MTINVTHDNTLANCLRNSWDWLGTTYINVCTNPPTQSRVPHGTMDLLMYGVAGALYIGCILVIAAIVLYILALCIIKLFDARDLQAWEREKTLEYQERRKGKEG